MELRRVLFGYKLENHRYIPIDTEAEIVRDIFKRYINGEILKAIADDLTLRQVVYYKEKNTWNKNMVSRILENQHYTGDDEYEAIISKEMLAQAKSRRGEKGGKRETDSPEVKFLKRHSVCPQCGGRFTRIKRGKYREKWLCIKGCKTDIYIDDKVYYSQIIEIIDQVIKNPALLKMESVTGTYTASLEIVRQEKEISRMLDQPQVQFHAVKTVIFECAASRFACCELDYARGMTDLLIDYYRKHEPISEIILELMKLTVSSITIKQSGKIAICFANGKAIEMEAKINDECSTGS